MRCFVAIELPPDIQQALGAVQTRLCAALRDARIVWTAPRHMHLTLRFFADVPEDQRGALEESLEAAIACFAPCTAQLDDLGAFPEAGPPRVVWVGLSDGRDEVVALEQALANSLDRRGWRKEERAFHPHITLGRIKGGVVRPPLLAAFAACPALPPLAFPVDHLTLIRSVLTPRGPQHAPVYRTRRIAT